MKLKRLDDYKKNEQLFVINMSKGDVLIELDLPNGKSNQLTIPKTNIPIDLTSYASIAVLKNSQDLRTLLNPGKKMLKICDTEKALEILDTEDSQDEMERLHNDTRFIKDDSIKVTDSADFNSVVEDGVNMKVKSILSDESLNDRKKYIKIKSIKDELSLDDVKYIKLHSNISDLIKWLNKEVGNK